MSKTRRSLEPELRPVRGAWVVTYLACVTEFGLGLRVDVFASR